MAAQCFHEIAVLYAQSLSSVQLCDPMDCGIFCLWNSPGKNTGVGCHFLLQGIFLTQGSNLNLLRLLHCRQILYPGATRETPVGFYFNLYF